MTQLVTEEFEVAQVAASSQADSQNAAVERTAFYLSSRNEPLMAWLHTAKCRTQLDHGVVLCAPIGFEQLHSARSLRHLADAVAARGIPTLRFDWHGTGDSAGSDADPARRATWHANVRDAVARMRSLGCRRVSVVGLRMGAMLAVEALNADECDNLVLWAPVVCGKSYLRQMQSIELMAELRPRPTNAAAGDIEAAGFLLSEATAEQLGKLNLLQKQMSCLQALLVGPFDKRLVERFAQFDIPVEQLTLPGFAEMMAEPHYSRVPMQTVREIAAWLGKRIVTPSAAELTIDLTKLGATQTLLAQPQPEDAPTAAWGTVRERILRFGGEEANLFAVSCEPSEPDDELPTIIMLNAGAASHVGPGRFSVQLSRHFASQGYRCVRLDIRGLGESVVAHLDDENNPYPTTVFRDVELTMQEMRERFGVRRCVLMGLCSGAYAAFQSAAQLSDPMLVESVLINPLTFHWQDGMPFDASDAERVMKEHCYMARATNLRKLWKFVRGKTEIGYVDALRLLRRRLRHYVKQLAAGGVKAAELRPIVAATHPAEANMPADLARVVAANRRLALFLSENDPGQAILSYHAPREAKAMQRSGSLRIEKIAGGDHTFSRRAPREKLIQAVSQYLSERYPANGSSR